MSRAAVLVLLLGLFQSSSSSLPPPRTSFSVNSADRPLVHFSLPDTHNVTTLLLSNDHSVLYVGARDAILSLDVSQSGVIRLKKKMPWSPSDAERNDCRAKGKDPLVDCPNFVHVLQPLNSTHLYTCGSYSYSPQDAYIDTESFSIVEQRGAKGRCPFSPVERSTAVIIDSELFTATTTDFRGLKPQISRFLSKDGRPDVNLDSSISLLEEPTFVSSSLDQPEDKLYFFFSEIGKEFSFVDDLQIARVAQVCKNDVGGQRTLQKKWTSFAKAPLLCQTNKKLPFNVLQDVFTLQQPNSNDATETLFYGVFTSQWSACSESAVCVFKLQNIREVFNRGYRSFIMQSHQWSSVQETHSYLGKCGLNSSSDAELAEVKKSFLTSNGVKPVGDSPIFVSSEQQYSRVAVMTTQAANGKQYTVLFLLTESGFLHKVALLDQGPRVIEEIQVFTQPQPVRTMVLSSSKGVLYVGTFEGVTAVPVAHCSTYKTCSQCVLARDPLCGWNWASRVCSSLDGSQENIVQNLEDGVEEKCRGKSEAVPETEVIVKVNEAVRLRCLKPSNLANLTWTSPQFRSLPEKLFIQSADGSLRFLATTDTFGTYRCEAEEGGYKEVVMSYKIVSPTAQPRSLSPVPTDGEQPQPMFTNEPYENVATEEPTRFVTQRVGTRRGKVTFTTDLKSKTTSKEKDHKTNRNLQVDSSDITPSSMKEFQPCWEPGNTQKSYYGELVAVSILLMICICLLILESLHLWRQRKASLKLDPLVSPTNKSVEICSLSSRDGLKEPELKVMG